MVGTSGREAAVRRVPPTLDLERELLTAGARLVAGMDEVGRGAIAGPVSVGVVVVDADATAPPETLRDSKLLTPSAREALCEPIRSWCRASAVGHASPREVDDLGIVGALRAAGLRALAAVSRTVRTIDVVVLDGVHDWLSAPVSSPPSLLDLDDAAPSAGDPLSPPVVTRAKADLTCASVAAASVLAKCERDALMTAYAADHPGYGWERNKGYGSASHREALLREGLTPLHRASWRLLR